MDGTLRTWDIRPFIDDGAGKKKRHDKTFVGGTHNAEKGLLNCAWSADGTMVTGGSADRIVRIWDEFSTEEVRMSELHVDPIKLCSLKFLTTVHKNICLSSSTSYQDTMAV
jgi:Prp8 binding protein